MATARQLEIYKLHKDTCIGNGIGQTIYYHRVLEGTEITTPGHPQNIDFQDNVARTQDNPLPAGVLVWVTWQPRRLMAVSEIAGDVKAVKEWIFRMIGQCAAIDDAGNLLPITDEDFLVDPQNRRFRIENPIITPDNAAWQFEGVRNL